MKKKANEQQVLTNGLNVPQTPENEVAANEALLQTPETEVAANEGLLQGGLQTPEAEIAANDALSQGELQASDSKTDDDRGVESSSRAREDGGGMTVGEGSEPAPELRSKRSAIVFFGRAYDSLRRREPSKFDAPKRVFVRALFSGKVDFRRIE